MILKPYIGRPAVWSAIGAGAMIMVALGLWAGHTTGATPAPVTSESSSAAQKPQQFHGSGGDALDWPNSPTVSLDEALAKMRGTVSLPDESVAGAISKVVFDVTATDAQGYPGVLILYRSGVKLMIAPGIRNLGEMEAEEAAPFEDGRKRPFERSKVAGRDYIVGRGGNQVLARGKVKVNHLVMWNMNGYTYTVVAGTDSVTMGDLMKVAQSIR